MTILRDPTMLPADPTHPGEMLLKEFLEPMGISQVAFAKHLRTSVQRVNELIKGKRSVTAQTAWLLSEALGPSPQFWLNLQQTYDLVHSRPKTHVKLLRKAG